MEHIYQLNIPSFEEIANLTDNVKNKYFPQIDASAGQNHLYKCYLNVANEILKPEFSNFLGIEWHNIVLFHGTNGYKCPIHTDMEIGSLEIPWGINWITGGKCIVEFWSLDDLETSNSLYTHISDSDTFSSMQFNIDLTPLPNAKPIKVYYLDPGKAYLFNATVPHCVTSFDLKTTISLRTDYNHIDYRWDVIVEKLKDYIIV
jgi:hypothetical protein